MVSIHPRSDWTSSRWADDVPTVAWSRRTEFFIHYEGGSWTKDTGAEAMRSIHAGHRARGWAGIGYNFVGFQDGGLWEGRGWTRVGAHCPDHNTTGIGVQIHIGGDQEPTDAVLRAVRALYDEACERAGRRLAIRGHRDGYATECPGRHLYAWVRAGLPAPKAPAAAPAAPVHREVEDMFVAATSASADGSVVKGGIYQVGVGQRRHITDPAVWGPLQHVGGAVAVPLTGDQIVTQWPQTAPVLVPPRDGVIVGSGS